MEKLFDYTSITKELNRVIDAIGPETISDAVNALSVVVDQTDSLAPEFRHAINGFHNDAKLLVKSSYASSKLVEALETDSKTFSPIEFTLKLDRLIKGEFGLEECEESTALFDWNSFGNKFNSLIKKVPVYDFMYGSFEPNQRNNEADDSKRVRRPRAKPDLPQKKVAPTIVDTEEAAQKAGKDVTVIAVENLLESLHVLYSDHNEEPVLFIKWVLDRNSFSKTVENLFHSMFLIKEGVIEVFVNESGTGDEVAMVKPCDKESDESQAIDDSQLKYDNKQAILSITMADWQRWCQLVV